MMALKNSIPALKSGNAGMLILLREKRLVEQNPKFSPTSSPATSRGASKYVHLFQSFYVFLPPVRAAAAVHGQIRPKARFVGLASRIVKGDDSFHRK